MATLAMQHIVLLRITLKRLWLFLKRLRLFFIDSNSDRLGQHILAIQSSDTQGQT